MISKIVRPLSLGILAVCVSACSSKPPPAPQSPILLVRAQPVAEPEPPRVIAPAQPLSPPGQMKPLPDPAAPASKAARGKGAGKGSGAVTPQQAIADATQKATQSPEEAAFFNAVTTYTFVRGGVYKIYTAPERVTDLILQPGEQVIADVATGDKVRWVVNATKSLENGQVQLHLLVSPMRPGLTTNLTIPTNRRTYFLELSSYADETYMIAATWRYPEDEMRQLTKQIADDQVKQAGAVTMAVDVTKLYFSYTVSVLEGSPTWTPRQVFDDGIKTYIRLPQSSLHREAPGLWVVNNNQTQLVNYRIRREDAGLLYVVDRLFRYAELRIGQKEQERVQIQRLEAQAAVK